ncbi:arylsulfatase [Sphingomonas sp.]|uniref:arylsulfatase n=1 Tax=Sphingomonas sp. TaxID=28214 RepID=UPI0035A84E20
MQKAWTTFAIGLLAFVSAIDGEAAETKAAEKAKAQPNIVVILADDAGLMDFGAYGGEAHTPNIDALTARGAMFTQFRASPLCSPSRAMLLTGMDNHLTGFATIPEVLPSEQRGKPGYSMALEPGVLTLADRLRGIGYRTLMVGKWHLGEETNAMPQAHGFDRSFALAASGADNWQKRPYIPYYKDAPWYENGVEAELPHDFYSSKFIVDKMIAYLDQTDQSKPFFAYLPFQAIHIPVQAPADLIAKYKGRYAAGWDVLRRERQQRAKALGLVPPDAAMADLPPGYRHWTDLSDADRAVYAARMEVHAAMLEAMDHHVGRLIAHLKANGQYDNTIFVFASDNGPEPSRGDDNHLLRAWHRVVGYHVGLDGMGGRGSWGFIGPEWAAATATPGAWFKFYATEGGVRVPLVIAGPGVAATRIDTPAMMTDIAPTLLELIEARVGGGAKGIRPMTGRSLLPVLTGKATSTYAKDEVRVIEVSGNTALYKNDFKITRSVLPLGDGRWRLFDLARDPGETKDLSVARPHLLTEMVADYDAYAVRIGVLAMPEGYDSAAQTLRNNISHMLENYPWLYGVMAGMMVLTGLVAWGLFRALRRSFRRTAA